MLPLLPAGTLPSALAWPVGHCPILPCSKHPRLSGNRLSAHRDIYQTIRHLCPWKSLGLATSRGSFLTNRPPQPPTFSSDQLSCRPRLQAGPLNLFFTTKEASEKDLSSFPALESSSVPCSSSGNGGLEKGKSPSYERGLHPRPLWSPILGAGAWGFRVPMLRAGA